MVTIENLKRSKTTHYRNCQMIVCNFVILSKKLVFKIDNVVQYLVYPLSAITVASRRRFIEKIRFGIRDTSDFELGTRLLTFFRLCPQTLNWNEAKVLCRSVYNFWTIVQCQWSAYIWAYIFRIIVNFTILILAFFHSSRHRIRNFQHFWFILFLIF